MLSQKFAVGALASTTVAARGVSSRGATLAAAGAATKSAVSMAEKLATRAALEMPTTQTTTLGSGLRVASENSGGETATVGVFINTGSRYETAKNNGVAHFLEHMAFKGTKSLTQAQLERKIENMGGHLNAYTSREHTVYYAKVFKGDVPEAVNILSDILLNATLDAGAIERERDVILREAEEVAHQVEEVVFDHLHAVAFQGTSLARTILGPEENIRAIQRADLVDYINTHYTAPRMVVAGAGAVTHEQLVKVAESAFAGLPKGPAGGAGAAPVAMERARFTSGDMRVRNDDLSRAHFALCVEGVGWAHADFFPLMVAQCIVGTWDKAASGGANVSSKLATVIAENHLAHSMVSFNTCYQDTGLWGVMASADPATLEDLVYVIEQEWVRLSFSPSDKEVARARNQLKTSMLMQLDGTTAVAEDIGRQLLTYRRRLTPAEVIARIDAVDAEAIKRVANTYIYNKSPTLAAVGPIANMPNYARLESWNYWARV